MSITMTQKDVIVKGSIEDFDVNKGGLASNCD